MECTCRGWNKSAEQIFSLQVMAAITKNIKYTGDEFKFCPWCGQNLAVQQIDAADEETYTLRQIAN